MHIDRARGEFTFVQIGANDGVSFDWIFDFVTSRHLRGFVVEPLADMFEALRQAYTTFPNVTPIRVAIHRTAKEIDLYRVAPELATGLPDWAHAIASVDKDHHKKSGIPSSVIRTEKVPCITLGELLETYRIDRLDFLQIDVEGYDSEILRMLDLEVWRPSVIRFEHNSRRAVMPMTDLLAAVDRLLRSGYLLIMDTADVVAYLPE